MIFKVYIVHKGYISNIVSCNSSQNLSFVKLVILSNSYASRIWTKLYFHQKNRKYEVILPIIMLKTFSIFQFWCKKTSRIKKIQEIVINIQTNAIN